VHYTRLAVQDAIGDHALIADGRTAALIDTSGNIVWLCWPRIDSTPFLFGLLDDVRGGVFSVRPRRADARVITRRYDPGTLVLESVWQVGRSRLTVSECLAWDGPRRLLRRLRCDGDPVDVVLRFAPSVDMGATRVEGRRLHVAGGGLGVSVLSPAQWTIAHETALSDFAVAEGELPFVVLQDTHDGEAEPPQAALEATLSVWTERFAGGTLAISPLAARAIGEERARELLVTTRAVLVGLTQRGGGIVAAPTTSLPQWPGSSRTWDYRYCWMRDAALAGAAMLRLGCADSAVALATFLGGVLEDSALPSLVRIDGTPPPAERVIDELRGYRGARPVRLGNAAALQLQLDLPGEISQLAVALADAGVLPGELAAACGRLGDWIVDHWRMPDHGIWEIRSAPRHYTHSRVMAWAALRDALILAERGLAHGDLAAWQRCAEAIHRDVTGAAGALQLHADGGGADAALASVPLAGFLPAVHPTMTATLDLITARLGRSGLLDRYEGRPDGLDDPCGPFLFPTFWLATAMELCARDGASSFRAAANARGATGLFGEVADPADGSPLGNYPQVQSHAAFALAATT